MEMSVSMKILILSSDIFYLTQGNLGHHIGQLVKSRELFYLNIRFIMLFNIAITN